MGLALSTLVLVIGAALVFARRRRLSLHSSRGLSETFLFVISTLCISTFNAFGFILQSYLANTLRWHSYNVHDILVGQTLGRVDYFGTIYSAIPWALASCTLATALAHNCKKPWSFFLLFSACFFLAMSVSDVAMIIVYWRKLTSPLGESILANFVGSPLLGVLATSLYFFVARTVDGLSWKLRCASALFLGVLAVSIFGTVFFVLDRVFLAVSPTYFEGKISAKNDRIPMLLAPPLDASTGEIRKGAKFDPISTPHRITNHFETYATSIRLNWSPETKNHAAIAAYSVFDCSASQFEEVARYFKPEADQYSFSSPMQLTTMGSAVYAVVPAAKWRNFQFSGDRNYGPGHSFYTSIAFDKEKATVSLIGTLGEYNRVFFRPNADTLPIGIAAASDKPISVNLKFGKTNVSRKLYPTTKRKNARCVARVIRPDRIEFYQNERPTALIVVLSHPRATNQQEDPKLNSLAASGEGGIFEIGSVEMVDPYSSPDEPLAQGDLNLPPTLDQLNYKILASSGGWLAGDAAIR